MSASIIKGTSEQIAASLRADIEAGVLPAGTPLHQAELAERFGLSRIPVREALRTLEADGYITYRPNVGASVAEALRASELLQIVEMRECLDALLMHHAVSAIDTTAIRGAATTLAHMNLVESGTELRGMHEQFHNQLFASAKRPRIASTINEWRFRFDNQAGRGGQHLYEYVQRTRKVHQRLLAACRARDDAAVQRCVHDEYAIMRIWLAEPVGAS